MLLRDLEGKRVVLWGGAREASALIRAVNRAGVAWDPAVLDEGASGSEMLETVPVHRGSRALDLLKEADVIVRSPGISKYRPELARAADSGTRITSATNLWFGEIMAGDNRPHIT